MVKYDEKELTMFDLRAIEIICETDYTSVTDICRFPLAVCPCVFINTIHEIYWIQK
jgi:hypothetical protein